MVSNGPMKDQRRRGLRGAGVHVLNGIPVRDEAECFLEQRALHAIHDEAVQFPLHDERSMAGRDQEFAGPFHRLGRRPWRRHDFGGRNEVGRVDRVHDDAAMPARHVIGEGGRQQRRRGACDHGIGGHKAVDAGEDVALDIPVLRRVLLYVDDPIEGLREIRCGRDAREHVLGFLPAQQIIVGEVAEHARDIVAGTCRRFGQVVPHGDLMAGTRETDRPAASDEPASDDGYLGHWNVLPEKSEAPGPFLDDKIATARALQRLDIAVDAERLAGNVVAGIGEEERPSTPRHRGWSCAGAKCSADSAEQLVMADADLFRAGADDAFDARPSMMPGDGVDAYAGRAEFLARLCVK